MSAFLEAFAFDWRVVASVILVTLVLGLYIALVYRLSTPQGSFSVSIQHSLLYLGMIVALVMLVVSNQVARAFTLVGALAVIRFRTPVKSTKDASFIFLALASGMGAGVGMYGETALGVGLIGLVMMGIRFSKIGLKAKGEVLVKFSVPTDEDGDVAYHTEIFRDHLSDHRLINTRSAQDGTRLEMTFLVRPKRSTDLAAFARALSSRPGIEKATVIVCDDEGLAQNVF
jgi:uncharacterized membrane protein YhiD involved in acid resistance